MDRFIGGWQAGQGMNFLNLKSNMDRFIVYTYDSITIKNFI